MKNYILSFSLSLFLFSCVSNSEDTEYWSGQIEIDNSVCKWIYEVMGEWYLWNDDLKKKNPDFDKDYENFFYSILSRASGDGKLNYYYSDIERLPVGTRVSQELELGFGFEFALVLRQSTDFTDDIPDEFVFAVVNYVYEGTPAWNAGLRRGHHIGTINGTRMTLKNYPLLYHYLLSETNGGIGKPVEITWYDLRDSGREFKYYSASFPLADITRAGTATLSPVNIENNPIFKYEVIDTANGNAGYIVYNAFDPGVNNTYDEALKRVFSLLKNESINDLILDLRYNPGGYVKSCQLLSSMIVPASMSGKPFQKIRFNEEIIARYGSQTGDVWLNFLGIDEMSSNSYGTSSSGTNLGLEKIYILAGEETASCAESVIHCLRGAGIEVYHIGNVTEGKSVGTHLISSLDNGVYFADGYEYRLWPVSFSTSNALGESVDSSGLVPDYLIDEYEYMQWKPLGDREEPLLAAALHHIRNGAFPPTGFTMEQNKRNTLDRKLPSGTSGKVSGSRIDSAIF